jgi:hypothetical protein
VFTRAALRSNSAVMTRAARRSILRTAVNVAEMHTSFASLSAIVSSKRKRARARCSRPDSQVVPGILNSKCRGVASVPYCWGGFEGGVCVLLPLELPLGLVLLLPVLLEPVPVVLESVEPEPLLLVSLLLVLMLESLDFFL